MSASRIPIKHASAGRNRCPGMAPDNMLHGRSARARVEPQVLKPDSGSYLSQLQSICDGILTEGETWIGQLLAYD